jgi:hypothetical protein
MKLVAFSLLSLREYAKIYQQLLLTLQGQSFNQEIFYIDMSILVIKRSKLSSSNRRTGSFFQQSCTNITICVQGMKRGNVGEVLTSGANSNLLLLLLLPLGSLVNEGQPIQTWTTRFWTRDHKLVIKRLVPNSEARNATFAK